MMNIIEEINANECGALFRRADLHIHSFGEYGSYDVNDKDMTPENIIDLAIKENLDVISITDHNSIGNVRKAIQYASGKPILVVPGVELSTTQGHLLVYFPDTDSLEDFFGKLTISRDRVTCDHTIPQCLEEAQRAGGIGIASHIDTEAGFELAVSGYGPFKEQILKCSNLLGFEVASVNNESWYSERDENADRKRLFIVRRNSISEDNGYEIAKVLFSDAHTLQALGKNASGNKKITRLKMDNLSFESFRVSLIDATARVRIEEMIPTAVPHFVGIKFEGGFLDGQVVKFSKNLTCIIGGRGTGKSTMLEALRAAAGNSARKGLIDCEIWPDKITLVWEDEAGRQQVLNRDKFCGVENFSVEDGLTFVPLESYGQGETAETIQHCDKDPSVLLSFLDGFINFGTMKTEDEEIRGQLLENQKQIERLTLEVNAIPDIKKALNNATAQLEALKAQNANEIIELESSLAKEKSFRGQLIQSLSDLIKSIKSTFSDTSITELVEELDGSSLVAGKQEFENVKKLLEQYSNSITKVSENINVETDQLITQIKEQLNLWQTKEKDTLLRIETIRKGLEEQGIRLDMAFIRKTTSDVSDYSRKLKELENKKKLLKESIAERRQLVKRRFEIRSRIFAARYGLANTLNENLKATVVDYMVTVKFREGLLSSACEKFIQDKLGWKTSQVPKATLIASQISVPDLLKLIVTQDISRLVEVRDSKGNKVFTASDAASIIQGLNSPEIIFALERCEYEDRPEITVTKFIEEQNGQKRPLTRDFSRLSLGQQQSILLSVLLYSKSTQPLIIDQPEDNLDSEFIYKTLVRN